MIHELKLPAHIFRELTDIQLAVHEKDADHGGGQEVREIVGEHGQLVQFLLILCIYGVQFFIDRLQFLI